MQQDRPTSPSLTTPIHAALAESAPGLPSMEALAEGARRNAQKQPRLGRAFLENILLWVVDLLEDDGSDPVFVLLAERRGWLPQPARPERAVKELRERIRSSLTTEAELRSILVEMHVLCAKDSKLARRDWAGILGMED